MNLPILSENRSYPALWYRNYHFILQTAGKNSAMFRCSSYWEEVLVEQNELLVFVDNGKLSCDMCG